MNINLTENDITQIIKNSIQDALSKDKLREIFLEVIEDVGFGRAIEEGDTGEYIEKKTFMKNLDKKIISR